MIVMTLCVCVCCLVSMQVVSGKKLGFYMSVPAANKRSLSTVTSTNLSLFLLRLDYDSTHRKYLHMGEL